MQYVRYEVLQTCSEDMRWPYHPIRPAHATKIRLETRCLAVLGLLGWEPGSLPGFNATFHVADIGKAHVLEGLCRDRTQGPNHTVGDDRARAIVQPCVAPRFRDLIVRREEQVAVADVDRTRDAGLTRGSAITHIDDQRVRIVLHPPSHVRDADGGHRRGRFRDHLTTSP